MFKVKFFSFYSQKFRASKKYKTFYIKTSQFEAKTPIRSVNQLQKQWRG